MRKTLAGLALALTIIGGGTIAAGANGPPPPNPNQVEYWCPAGGVKYEPVDTPFVVPAPPAGFTWTLLVLKAGSGDGENEQFPNPVVGQAYSRTDGKDISHAILCKAMTTTVPTTPTSVGTTLLTVPTTLGTTTTTVCIEEDENGRPCATTTVVVTNPQTVLPTPTTISTTTTGNIGICCLQEGTTTTTTATTIATTVPTTPPTTTPATVPTTPAPTPEPAPPVAPPELPVTGVDEVYLGTGMMLVGLGLGLVAATRRRVAS